MDRSFVENNLVAGVYTHHDKYFKKFTENFNHYYYGVELIYNVRKGKINQNMEKLRHDFIATGKRYWLFMDEDILFTRNDVIETALKYMKKNKLDIISVYQSRDYNIAKNFDPHNLSYQNLTWIAGYFMLVDSEKCGLVPIDLNLPTTHGSLADITYCMDILKNDPANSLIGIAPSMVYHNDKGYSPVVSKPFELTEENQENVNKKVKDFLKNLDKNLLFGNPKIEIVLLDNGEVDYNETIGHHYLKNKHPEIYHRVVARPSYYNLEEVKKIKNFTNQI